MSLTHTFAYIIESLCYDMQIGTVHSPFSHQRIPLLFPRQQHVHTTTCDQCLHRKVSETKLNFKEEGEGEEMLEISEKSSDH